MKEIFGDVMFSVVDSPDTKALIVDVKDNVVHIVLNKNKAYRILAHKDLIVAGLNKKLSELIQIKLEALAKKEEKLEDGK